MFSGRRKFRIIAFKTPKIESPHDVIQFLPIDSISTPEEFGNIDNGSSFAHFFFHRKKPYNPAHEDIEDLQVIWNNQTMYRYNMYVGQIKYPEGGFLNILAVPFTAMAVELFSYFSLAIRGSKNRYIKIDIDKLINNLRTGNNLDGNIKATKLELEIGGEVGVKTFLLSGSDVPNSKTFRKVQSSLKDFKVKSKKCRFVYDDRSKNKISVEVDRFGNYVIPLHTKGANLPVISLVFDYLFKNESIIIDSTLPSIISLKENASSKDV